MTVLRRVSDGEGDCGSRVDIIEWNEDGTFKSFIPSGEPTLGCSVRVGSVTARSYHHRDWWMTTPVTKINQGIRFMDGSRYWLFETKNSVYELYDCDVETLKQMREQYDIKI